MTIILVANKADNTRDRKVSFKEGTDFARRFQYDYIEVSAKTGMNINILFEILCKSYIKKNEFYESRKKRKTDKSNLYFMDKSINITNRSGDKKMGGCC